MEVSTPIIGSLEGELAELRETFRSGKTRSYRWRKTQLKGILTLLNEKEGDILKALKQDLGKHHVEAFRDEVGTVLQSVKFALEHLKKWMASKAVRLPLIAVPSSAQMVPEPLGVVLILSSWNYPFCLSFVPIIGAIAAGNTVVVKPSELAPTSSSLIASMIPMYLDNEAVKVVEGGPVIAERLLENKWDKIFFTGSVRVGRIVMAAAAKYVTPVTLELGGKCPAVVDSLSDSKERKIAIKRMALAKYGACAGQLCIAVDYILVEEKFASTLIDLMKTSIKEMYGENPKDTNSIARIVNRQHFRRLKNLLIDPTVKASIVHGGSMDEDDLFIEPTILLNPPLTAEIMTEEIFGPILPIITLKNIGDSIEFINSRPKPLALYVFTSNEKLKKCFSSETSSGSLMFNDTVTHYLCDTIPFGGVGQSGFGSYHGKFSFDTFSHMKPVVRRVLNTEIPFKFPPWSERKMELLRSTFRQDYLQLVLLMMGLKKP